jgi:peptide/nickel transport system substrate-binding protein
MDRRWSSGELSRRNFVKIVGVGSAALAVQGLPASAFAQSSSLVMAVSSNKGAALDPIEGHPEKMLKYPLYDYLIGADASGNDMSPDTGIASHWEEAPDGLTWTFTLREGIPWHKANGIVTADDAAFTINRLIGPDITTINVGYFKSIKHAEAVDKKTLVVHMNRRAVDLAYMLSAVCQTEGMLLPKAYYEKVGRDGFRANPVGSGPYEFVSQVPGQTVKYRSAGKHWSMGTPRYENLEITQVAEDSTRLAMLRKGQANLIELPRRLYAAVKKESRFTVACRIGDASYNLVMPEQTLGGPLANPKFRAALSYAIDRNLLVKLFGGSEIARPSTDLAACGGWDPGCPPVGPDPFDQAKARALVKESGVQDPSVMIHVAQLFPEQQDVSEALAAFWEPIGVKTKIVPVDFGMWRAQTFARKTPANSTMVLEMPNEVLNAVSVAAFYSAQSPIHFATNPKMDGYFQDMAAAKTIADLRKAEAAVKQIVFQEHYELPLVTSGTVLAFDHTVTDRRLGGHQFVDPGLREILTGT